MRQAGEARGRRFQAVFEDSGVRVRNAPRASRAGLSRPRRSALAAAVRRCLSRRSARRTRFSLADVAETVPRLLCLPEHQHCASAAADGRSAAGGAAMRSKAPRDFASEMRKIIESARVSASLSRRIDLIFG
jgi:hypothetical protein